MMEIRISQIENGYTINENNGLRLTTTFVPTWAAVMEYLENVKA